MSLGSFDFYREEHVVQSISSVSATPIATYLRSKNHNVRDCFKSPAKVDMFSQI